MLGGEFHQTECCRWPPALSMRPGLLPHVSTHSLAASIASAPLKPPLYSTLMAVSGSERTSLKASLHAVPHFSSAGSWPDRSMCMPASHSTDSRTL